MREVAGYREDVLRRVGLLRNIPTDDLPLILEVLRLVHCRFWDDELICRAGDPADDLWIIDDGLVTISGDFRGETCNERIAHRQAPCVIGEAGIVADENTRGATVRALGRVDAYRISKAAIEAATEKPSGAMIWKNLASILAAKLSQATLARVDLTADGRHSEELLRRFVNPHGLSAARGLLRVREGFEREFVVVWFSDVAGFSAIAEQVEPATVGRMIRQCMEAQTAAIDHHRGYIDKFVGDGLMAYWLVEGDRREDRERACMEALAAAEEALERVRTEVDVPAGLPGPLQLRIGLHIGEAVSGNFGSDDRWAFTLIGDTVNRSARLEQAKRVLAGEHTLGPIRVSEDFHALLGETEGAKLVARSKIDGKHNEFWVYTSAQPDYEEVASVAVRETADA